MAASTPWRDRSREHIGDIGDVPDARQKSAAYIAHHFSLFIRRVITSCALVTLRTRFLYPPMSPCPRVPVVKMTMKTTRRSKGVTA
jgi:hypothetical protein